GEVDDLAVVQLAQVGDEGPAHQDGAEEVDADGLDPLVPIDFLEQPHRAVDAGVVDEDAQVREVSDGVGHGGGATRGVGDVAPECQDALPGAGGQESQLRLGLAEQFLAAGDEQHAGPGADVVFGDGAAQSLVGAGDEGG